MNLNAKQINIQNKIIRLKRYRSGLKYYNLNKEKFNSPKSTIKIQDNIAYFEPLNDIENYIRKGENILTNFSRGNVIFEYLISGMIIFVIIVLSLAIALVLRRI